MTTASTTAPMTRGDRVVLSVFALASAAFGAASIAGGAARLRLYVRAADGGGTPVSLMTDSNFTPFPLDPEGPEPRVEFGAFPTADLLVVGLDDGTRTLLALGEGLSALVAAVVSLGVAWLFVSLARGRPFDRRLHLLALVSGATLALGSLLGQGLTGLGKMSAATALNGDDRLFVAGFDFDPVPVMIGFAILALAFVFRAGSRLERETDGLV